MCASWLDRVSSLSPFFPPLEHRQKYTPSLPIYGMPISSTMLLILIYMTRPTATRNHRRVHRDGNYKFMYPPPLPTPSRAVRKSFRSGRFAFRDLLRPPSPFRLGSFRVLAFFFFFFYEAFLLSHLLIDRIRVRWIRRIRV